MASFHSVCFSLSFTASLYLLYGIEVGIVEVPKEPEDPRAQHLSEEEDEGGEVEDVDHADQPVDEHGGAGGQVETGLAIFQRGVKHRLQGKQNGLNIQQQGIFQSGFARTFLLFYPFNVLYGDKTYKLHAFS